MAASGKKPNGLIHPKDNSPFTPGNPVPVELFVGREKLIEEILHYARQSCMGRLENIFLVGERGIGKSSLAQFVKELCQKDCKMLGIHTHLGGVSTVDELVRRVFEQLLKEAHTQNWFSKIKGFFGNYIKEVGLFGVSVGFSPPPDQLEGVVRDFPAAVKNIHEALKDDYRGLVIILDDLNGLADQAEFANWYKSFVDQAATRGLHIPALFVLCGLPERRDSLARLQPSLMRIFHIAEVERLNNDEVVEFFIDSFKSVGIESTNTVFQYLASNCHGLPALMQEVGDAVFQVDCDGFLDLDDYGEGVANAANEVGTKYLDPLVYRAVRSKQYLDILDKIADFHHQVFNKQDVEKELNDKQRKVFHNFLQRFCKLGLIESLPGSGRGEYRFVNQLYYLYFAMQKYRKGKLEEE